VNTNQTPEHPAAAVVDGIPLTEWQDVDVRPQAVGVYKTQYVTYDEHGDAQVVMGYSHWNGKTWGPQFDTPAAAEGGGQSADFPAPQLYRGLTSEHPEHQL